MKKKVSIVGFSEIWFAVLWITFSIMLLSLYLLLSIHLKSTLVHKSNRENIRRIEHLLVQDDQEGITIEEPYTLDKGYFIVLLDQDNKVIAGSCPAEFRDYDFALKKEETLEIDGKKYHLDFKRIPHKEIRKIYVLCAIADIRAAATMLDEIRTNIIVFFILGVTGVIVLFFFVSERITRPLRRMSEDVEKLGTENLAANMPTETGFTEIDALEAAYRRLYERMALVIKNQNRFNADVSHELRTPITVIQTQCQLGKEHALEAKDEEIAEMMDVIDRQTEKMNRIINILMLLTKLESGTVRLNAEKFDLATLIETICDDEEFLQASDREIICELEETIVSADVNLIMIAVRNILSNAVKYSGDGSQIRIRCGIMDGRPYCSAADQGIGIRKENMDQIFNAFYRAEESRSSEGMGLGLSLAKRIMEIHGGEIRAESVPGEGSTFTLYFAPQ